ncbi:reverse transcriptase [Caerostris darwini]|uniref:Reverse transcriptase n=1 Tax=Caerostris darwini TaxID=1538125 RepID=A0AAV4M9K4_9ARAC|nr:reverse transcriptase [Caerostris darwini]
MNAAIRSHSTSQWNTVLPTILLGFRAAWKEELQTTTAEILYGTLIRLPGEFLSACSTIDPATFVGKLRETMSDTIKKGLQPPYEGPFQVLSRSEKVFKLLIHGRQSVVNIAPSNMPTFPKRKKTHLPKPSKCLRNHHNTQQLHRQLLGLFQQQR